MAMEEGRAAVWEIDPRRPAPSHLRQRPPQSGRHRIATRGADALWAVGERARRDRQRSRPRLHDLGPGRRFLRLAVQLLRPACRRPRASRRGRTWSRGRSRPTIALGPHIASLGLTFSSGAALGPRHSRSGAFVGQHGSWNRKPRQRLQGDLRAVRTARSRRASRSTCSPASSAPTARPMGRPVGVADRRATARCSSPTMSATGSGGSARPAAELRVAGFR